MKVGELSKHHSPNTITSKTNDAGNIGKAQWQKLDFFGIPPTVRSKPFVPTYSGEQSSATVETIATPSNTSPIPEYPATTAVEISPTAANPSQRTHTVVIGPGLSFSPQTLFSNKGDKVQWNFTSTPHSITQSIGCVPIPGGFDSGDRVYPETFEMVVQERVEYMCTVGNHCEGGMKGIIDVQSLENGISSKNCISFLFILLCFL
jgi:plastocyanin